MNLTDLTLRSSTRRVAIVPLILIFWSLAGCGSLLETERPADERYWLEPVAEDSSRPLQGIYLQLDLGVVPGLDTERVLVLQPDSRLSQLGQARWADSSRDVLESVIGRSLVNAGAELSGKKSRAPCFLQVEVQEFFARGVPTSNVAVSMAVQLSCRDATTSFQLEHVVDSEASHSSVVAALQKGLDRSTLELVSRLASFVAGSAE